MIQETPIDRDLEPKFVIVYKVPVVAMYKIPRTHARSFETMEDLRKFLHDNEVLPDDLIGAWSLDTPITITPNVTEVTEVKVTTSWI